MNLLIDSTVRATSLGLSLIVCLCLPLSGCSLFESDKPAATVDGGVGAVCTSTSDCAEVFVCAAGLCQFEGAVGLGGSCWASRDCRSDLFCSPDGKCQPVGNGDVGGQCASAAECKKGLICVASGFSGLCAEAGDADLGEQCAANTDCIPGLACARDGTCKPPLDAYPPFTGVECGEDETPFRSYFEVPRPGAPPKDFYRLPFPSDVRVTNGVLDMSDFPRPGQTILGFDLVDMYVEALEADFTGFSSVAAVTFRFSSALDSGSLGSGANIHYVDVTEGTAEFGRDLQRIYSFTTGRNNYVCNNYLLVRNEVKDPLLPGHTYAVYMTTAIRSQSNSAAAIESDLAASLAAERPAEDEALAHAWDVHAPFRAFLASREGDEALDASMIAGLTVFTVQDTVGRVARLAAAVEASAAPVLEELTLCDEGVVSPCDDGENRVCGAADPDFYEIHGTYSVPIYQRGTSPYETQADGGDIVEVAGVPQQVDTVAVCLVMTIPRAKMPAQGWPWTLYAHGTGGTFRGAVTNGVARTLATASTPIALLSYDGVVHGRRRGDSARDPDSLMFNVINPRAARDNNLQGAVDVLQAFRIADLDPFTVTGVGPIDFDANRTALFGHSQGANVGIPALAVTSRQVLGILSGAGAYLTDGILNKEQPVNAKQGLEFLLGETLSRTHPLMVIWQTYFESADTLNYAPLLLKRPLDGVPAKHIYMSWGGSADKYSPKPTLNAMVRAAGLPVATPVLDDISDTGLVAPPVSLNKSVPGGESRTAACFQYAADGYDGHFVATRNPDAIADWTEFLTSAASTGTPTIP